MGYSDGHTLELLGPSEAYVRPGERDMDAGVAMENWRAEVAARSLPGPWALPEPAPTMTPGFTESDTIVNDHPLESVASPDQVTYP
jgi:hypothetical protein